MEKNLIPLTHTERKERPMARGLLDYFPDALAEVAHVSLIGNRQHNGPDAPLHWAKEKSTDHADCIIRHLSDRGSIDNDDLRHSAKVAWRALALLQTEIDKEKEQPVEKEEKLKVKEITFNPLSRMYFIHYEDDKMEILHAKT